MRTVVIVLLDPACDAQLGLVEVLIFVEPHLLFFQAAMESFDVTVALGMVVGGAPVGDAQLVQSFDIARRRKLGAVVSRQSQTRSPRTERQNLQHGAVERRQSFFRTTTQTQLPPDDFARAAVDHRAQIRPAHTPPAPPQGPVRLPRVPRRRALHPAPVLYPRDPA